MQFRLNNPCNNVVSQIIQCTFVNNVIFSIKIISSLFPLDVKIQISKKQKYENLKKIKFGMFQRNPTYAENYGKLVQEQGITSHLLQTGQTGSA